MRDTHRPSTCRRLISMTATLATGAALGYAGLALAGHEHTTSQWHHGEGYGDQPWSGRAHPFMSSTDGNGRQGFVQIAKASGYHYKGEVSDVARHIHTEIRHSVDQCVWRAHLRSPQTNLPHHDGHGCH